MIWPYSQETPKAAIYQLVRLTPDDLAAIVELEKACYEYPWTTENFLGELKRRLTISFGLKDRDGELVAFCFFWLIPPEIHLLNMAVKPDLRRLGLAKRLLETMIATGHAANAELLFLEARCGNQAAINLYKSFGFKVAGCRPAYYDDGEDAILMTLSLPVDGATLN